MAIAAVAQASKALSLAEGFRPPSLSTTLFASKPSLALLVPISFPGRRLLLISSSRSVPFLSSKKAPPFAPLVAPTSEWAHQDEEEEEDVPAEDELLHGEEGDEEAVAGQIPEGASSQWEGGDADGDAAAEGESEFAEEEDDTYAELTEDAKVYVGNLSYDIDCEKLAHLFGKAGIVEIAEVIYDRETDRSRGFGFVTMSTVEEAEKAIDMFHRYNINGRLLTVNKATPRGTRVERTRRDFDSSFKIYVTNLPWQVDGTRLEQVFSEHGKVLEAKVVYDRGTGRSRGFGFVTMASQAEMDDAIAALDGQMVVGRALRVGIAEDRPVRAAF